jgi:uncharacterized protein YdaU (DUF1376 family)
MADASAWMPLYVGDYLGDTQRLTTEQHGAYFLLLIDYWRNGPPPKDDAVLAQITRMDRVDWQRVRGTILRFFDEQDGVLIHGRVERELEKARLNVEKRVERAKIAAEARWGARSDDAPRNARRNAASNARRNATSMPQAMPEDMLEECPSPSPSPSSNRKPPVSPPKSPKKRPLPDDWQPEDFGEGTQSRTIVDKWSRLEFERQIERFRAHHQATGSKFVDWQKGWSTWVLNSERFERRPDPRPVGRKGDIVEGILAEHGLDVPP